MLEGGKSERGLFRITEVDRFLAEVAYKCGVWEEANDDRWGSEWFANTIIGSSRANSTLEGVFNVITL